MSNTILSKPSMKIARAWLWALGLSATFGIISWNTRHPQAGAQGPATKPVRPVTQIGGSNPQSDYSSRVVAFVYDSVPITREELGEYLIQRMGSERIEALVNKRIIEIECKKVQIEVTEAEVEAALEEDLAGLNVDRKVFVDRVLKGYKKTLLEWKEDVLRPKLMLGKLVKSRVKVTEADLKRAFDAYHGEKVDCRIIMWEKGSEKAAMSDYAKIRDSEDEFARAAKNQKSPTLASAGGKIRPLSRNTTGNEDLEKAAFSLQPGEVSALVGTPEGLVVIKCDNRVPSDTTVNFEAMRPKLTKEVTEKKIQAEIPVLFAEMRKKAAPKLLLTGAGGPENLTQSTKDLLNQDDVTGRPTSVSPKQAPKKLDPSVGEKP
ncbi:MAG: peptidylprolyl isomerase [Planctomycetota bacterium]|nr:peptidylprolyl isomerase [Planctomycetota bacterium]